MPVPPGRTVGTLPGGDSGTGFLRKREALPRVPTRGHQSQFSRGLLASALPSEMQAKETCPQPLPASPPGHAWSEHRALALISAVKFAKPRTSLALGQTSRELCPASPFHTRKDGGLERGGLCSGRTAGKQCTWARSGLLDRGRPTPCVSVVPDVCHPEGRLRDPLPLSKTPYLNSKLHAMAVSTTSQLI